MRLRKIKKAGQNLQITLEGNLSTLTIKNHLTANKIFLFSCPTYSLPI